MPFPSALSGGNQTTKRGGGYFERYLILHTPSIQLQFQPSLAASSNISGSIPYSSATSGSHTNCLLGMTVIISPSSDYASDLRNQPENCFVSYVRLAATATMLYIGQTKYQYTTSDYVTVLNDYRIFERKIRAISATDIRRDWDISYRLPKPRLTGIYSQAVFASGSTASISFTPSATVMAASGSISSWAWDVDDGTITSGSSSTQNITVSFPVGTRYVHLTATDSNGVSNYLTAFIAVLPSDLSSVIHLDNNAFSISKSLNSGNSSSFTALANGAWLDGSQALVATYAKYADGTSALTTSMVGWLKDISDNRSADDERGAVTVATATIQGIGYYASQIQSEGFYTELKNSPTVWGEFGRLSVYDALWYLASEHTTLPNVAAFDFESAYADYKFPSINIPSGTLSEVLGDLTFRGMGGGVNYAPNGELVFRKSLLYLTSDSDRNAADTYASYTTEDGFSLNYSRISNVEIKPVGQILMGCALYNTTTRLPRVYWSKAPAGDESGYLIEELDSIILPANTSDLNAHVLAGSFTANHYFAINENPTLSLNLLDGYHSLEPSNFQWHKFTLATGDTVSSAFLSTSDRFICTDVQISYNEDVGQVAVSANFRKETNGQSNYLQEAGYVPTNQPNVQPFVPQYVPQPFLDTGVDDEDIYDSGEGDNDESGNSGVQDPTLPPQQAGQGQGNQSNVVETLYVPMFSNTAVFSQTSLTNGQNYIFRITGDASLTGGEGTTIFDFTLGDQLDWEPHFLVGDRAAWTGTGWGNVNLGYGDLIVIQLPFTWPVDFIIKRIRWYISNYGVPVFHLAYGMPYTNPTYTTVAAFGTDGYQVVQNIDKGTRTGIGIEYSIFVDMNQEIYKAEIDWQGTNPFTTGESSQAEGYRGDAFYWKYNSSAVEEYPPTTGLFINAVEPTPPVYNAAHQYEISYTGTGATVPFQFYDPDNIYSDNSNSWLKVEILEA